MSLKFSNNKLIVFYKLLAETTGVVLLALSISLLVENLLPGIISAHLSFLRLTIVLLLLALLLSFWSKKLNLKFKILKLKTFSIGAIIIFIALNLFLSLWKFNLSINLIITVTSLAIIFYNYKLFQKPI